MNLGEVFIDVSINEGSLNKLENQISAKIKKLNSQQIKIKVDDSRLFELNEHLDEKIKHLTEVINFYKNNEITPGVSTSSAQSSTLNADRFQRNYKESMEGLSKSFETILSPFKDFKVGLFENVGKNFSEKFSRALFSSIEKQAGVSFSGAGAKTGEVGVFVAKKIKEAFSNQQPINIPFKPQQKAETVTQPRANIQDPNLNIFKASLPLVQKMASGKSPSTNDIFKVIEASIPLMQKANDNQDIKLAKEQFAKIKESFKVAYASLKDLLDKGEINKALVLAETIKNNASRARKEIEAIYGDLKNSGVKTPFGSEIATAKGSVTGVLKSKYENPSARILDLGSQVQSTKAEATKIGQNVVSGIKTGLASNSGVEAQANKVALGILLSMRKTLGIKSPSTKAKELMEFLGRGLIQGLQGISRSVTSEADKLANKILGSFSGTAKIKPPKIQVQSAQQAQNTKFTGTIEDFDKQFAAFGQKFNSKLGEYFDAGGVDIGREIAAMLASGVGLAAPQLYGAVALAPLVASIIPIVVASSALKAFFTPILARAEQALNQVEPVQNRLRAVKGSKELGNAEMSYLSEVSDRYSANLESGSMAYANLLAASASTKLGLDEIRNLFEGVSASISKLNLNTQESQSVWTAYTQILSKGKVSMEELRQQLGERFPPAMGIFAEALGVSVPELDALASKGALLSDEVFPKVSAILNQRYGDAASKSTDSFAASVNKLSNATFNLNRKIADGFGGIVIFINNIQAKVVNQFTSMFDSLKIISGAFLISAVAQIAVGFEMMFTKIPMLQMGTQMARNFSLSFIKNTTSVLVPFIGGALIDLLGQALGSQRSVMDNMMQGMTNLFALIFHQLDNLKRATSGGEGLFGASFKSPMEELSKSFEAINVFGVSIGNLVSGFKELFGSIAPGLGEMITLIAMFEQTKLLIDLLARNSIKRLISTFGELGKALLSPLVSLKNLGDAFQAIFANATAQGLTGFSKIKYIAEGTGDAISILSTKFKNFGIGLLKVLAGLKTFAIEAALALGVMALAQSDFSDPISKAVVNAQKTVVENFKSIKAELKNLADEARKTGADIKKALTLELPSKGLELSISKILGISDDSYKSDDLIKEINKVDDEILRNNPRLAKRFAPKVESARNRAKEAKDLGLQDYIGENDYTPTLAQEQLLNQARYLSNFFKELPAQIKGLGLDEINKLLVPREIAERMSLLQGLDAKIGAKTEQRRNLALLDTSESRKQVRELDKEIDVLLRERKEKVKPLRALNNNVEDIVAKWDEAKKSIESADIPVGAKNTLLEMLEESQDAVTKLRDGFKQIGLTNLLKPLEDTWQRLIDKLSDAQNAFNKLTQAGKINTLNRQVDILRSRLSPDAKQANIEQVILSDLVRQQGNLETILKERKEALNKLLEITGIESNPARKDEVIKVREEVKNDELRLAELRLQIEQNKQNLITRLRDQSKQIIDFYKQVARDTEALGNDLASLRNTITVNNQKAKLREALLGYQESFVSSYIESLISIVDTLNQPLQQYLQNQQQFTQQRNAAEDKLNQIRELRQKNTSVDVNRFTSPQSQAIPQTPITGTSLGSSGTVNPVKEKVNISSGYGWRNIFGERSFHRGIDLPVGIGTNVLSPTAGRVSNAFNDVNGGLTVTIEAIDSAGRKIEQSFLHLSEILVKKGDEISQGQVIAKSGNSGKRTTGAHLDYRVKINGEWVNPLDFLGTNVQIPGSASGRNKESKPGKSKYQPGTLGYLQEQGLINFKPGSTSGFVDSPVVKPSIMPSRTVANTSQIGAGKYANTQDKLSPEFIRKASEVAKRLGTSPENLLAVMGFETGGTYSPSITNSLGMTGLIQFHPKYAPGNTGKTTAQLRQMSAVEQLDYVETYINKNRRGKSVESLNDLYMSVLMPSLVGKGKDATLPDWAYNSNKGLDINRDGKISADEATSKVRDYFKPNVNQFTSSPQRQGIKPVGNTQANSSDGAIEFTAPGVSPNEFILNRSAEEIKDNYLKQAITNREVLGSQQGVSRFEARLAQERAARQLQRGVKDSAQNLLGYRRGFEDVQYNASGDSFTERYGREILNIERKYEDQKQQLQDKVNENNSAIEQLKNTLIGLQSSGLFTEQIPIISAAIEDLSKQNVEYDKYLQSQDALKSKEFDRLDKLFEKEREGIKFSDYIRQSKARVDDLVAQAELLEVSQSNPSDMRFGDPLKVRNQIDKLNLEIDLAQSLKDLQDFAKTSFLSADAVEELRKKIISFNTLRTAKVDLEYENQVIKRDLERRKTELEHEGKLQSSKGNLLGATAEYYSNRGLGVIGDRYAKEQQRMNITVQLKNDLLALDEYAKTSGKNVEKLKEELLKLNEINLSNFNAQFDPWQKVANSAIESLSSGIEGLILGTANFGDVFQSFGQSIAQTLAKLAADWVTNELIQGIFGIGKGQTPSFNPNSGGIGGGIFGWVGSLLGFSSGGDVPSRNFNTARYTNTPIGEALRREGNNSVLATLTPGERVLTVEENRQYKQLMSSNKILGFKDGGEIPSAARGNDTIRQSIVRNNSFNIDVSTNDSGKTPDERELMQLIRAAVVAEVSKREKRRGGR